MLVRNLAVIVALLVLWLSPNAGSIARRCHIVNVLFQRLFIGVGLIFLTSGCTVGQADTATPAASTPPAVTVSPTVEQADAATPAASTPPAVATPPAGVSFPALLVIDTDQRTLMEYRNGQAQQRFADLTEGGTILDGMLVADAVVILQEERAPTYPVDRRRLQIPVLQSDGAFWRAHPRWRRYCDLRGKGR
jgi:hypothetical protein